MNCLVMNCVVLMVGIAHGLESPRLVTDDGVKGMHFLLKELGGMESVSALAFSTDGGHLLSAGSERNKDLHFTLTNWATKSWREEGKWDSGLDEQITRITYSPDCLHVAVGGGDGSVKVLDGKGRLRGGFRYYGGDQCTGIVFMGFLTEGKLFALDHDGFGKVYDTKSREVRRYYFDTMSSWVDSAAQASSLQSFAWIDSRGVYSRPQALVGTTRSFRNGNVNGRSFYNCALSSDGKLLLADCFDERLYLYDVSEERLVRSWRGHIGEVYAMAAIPKSRFFVTGGQDGFIRVWDENGIEVQTVRRYMEDVGAIAISSDGALMASCGERQKIVIWDLKAILATAKNRR